MPAITIRNIPEETRNELAARAARSGRSLQEFLRSELVELARKPDVATVFARARERQNSAGSRVSSDRLLDHLDADRR